LIAQATEQLAHHTGDAIGGLLNASFGNLPEMIIALAALRAGLFDMVRASLAGAIIANLLLAIGVSFLLGGFKYHDQEYSPVATRMYSSMMFIAVMSLAVPSAFGRLAAASEETLTESRLNLILAGVLLGTYALYLVFMLRTHPEFFRAAVAEGGEEKEKPWGIGRSVGQLVVASALAAWMSEVLVGAAEPTGKALGMSDIFIGIVFLAIIGGAAESGSAIVMARKNRMDLSVGIGLGSSIQIALFVAPVLVVASHFLAPHPFALAFSRGEIASLFMAVLIGALVSGDGRSNWYKGVQLITVYAIIAMMFFFMPEMMP
jgi:Ca2+:H+ antiporter